MAEASRRTGLSDWGDRRFEKGLCVLLESLRKNAYLNHSGWIRMHRSIVRNLVTRLQINEEIKRNNEILREKIVRPLFIVGIPRSGTTMLQRLLSRDPGNRFLPFWEALFPALSTSIEPGENDMRIARAEKRIRRVREKWPGYEALHPLGVWQPEECNYLLRNTFESPTFVELATMKHYWDWLWKQDLKPAYGYYRLQLQLLQSHYNRKRWILKSPLHLFALDALLGVFPDACVVQTHRDPLKAIPSACSLTQTLWNRWPSIWSRIPAVSRLSRYALGRGSVEDWARILKRSDRARETSDTLQFYDVHYDDLVQDPVGTVRAIYGHFGLKYDDLFERRMHEWLKENPHGKHGEHRYSLGQFGLKREDVMDRFSRYCERYKIPQS
jgi:hypothetical protein